MSAESPAHIKVRVWDLPVRLFHWILATLVVVSLTTGYIGGNTMLWHMRSGYCILSLVLFRIVYGLIGSTPARFAGFIHAPRAVWGYTRDFLARRAAPQLGHNPLGGWMVLALLVVLLIQTSTGLFANDDIATEGPLYKHISKALSDRLTGWHELNSSVLLILVVLHLLAILYHWRARGENLVRPMLSGDKQWPAAVTAPAVRMVGIWRAVLTVAAAAGAVWYVVTQT